MNYLKIFLLFLSLVIATSSAHAVEGYKELKFGISLNDVLESNICTLEENFSGQVGVQYYGCYDFPFSGTHVEAAAFFIDGKFLRFAIVPSIDIIQSLSAGLAKKYGPPSSMSTQAELQAVDKLPNRAAFIAFDSNTVYLRLMSDAYYSQTALLIYTDSRYDGSLMKKQKESMSSDL
jgi:hypothetical protein